MNESELRELLKLQRGIVHYIERCLKTEKEKNEERIKKQLESTGIEIDDSPTPVEATTEEWDF
jgi:hypothetical protein